MELNVIRQADPQVADAIEAELNRQRSHIELIASENFVSPAVMAAMGSCLTNKYAEGYPAHRYYGGCECVDVVENLARDRAEQLFGCEYVNVQPHSGAQANTAVYFAMLQPGDTVMGMSLSNGGHLTHGSPVNLSGKYFHFVPYGVDAQGYIDYDAMRALALECKPKMIVSGASADTPSPAPPHMAVTASAKRVTKAGTSGCRAISIFMRRFLLSAKIRKKAVRD